NAIEQSLAELESQPQEQIYPPEPKKPKGLSGLIPKEEIDRINDEADLVALVEAKGVRLRKVGKELQGLCPLHKDSKTPSLSIDPVKKVWHCFGCGKGGRAVQWVMHAERVGFRHAVEILRERHPLLAGSPQAVKTSTAKRLPCPLETSADHQELMRQVIAYYHKTLLKTPAALEYLKKRGLCHSEAIEKFQIGFCDNSLALRIPDKKRQAGALIRRKLQEIGIYRDNGREHLIGCLVFPIVDTQGLVTGAYGRRICQESQAPKHLYLKGPHKGMWNPWCLASHEIIQAEKIIDGMSWWVNDFRNVTASYGAHGFTQEMLGAFKASHVELVYLSYDPDDAGNEGVKKAAELLMREKIACKRVLHPCGMDTNDCILKFEPAHDYLLGLLHDAVYLGNGKTLVAFEEPEAGEEEVAKEENSELPTPTEDFSSLGTSEEELEVAQETGVPEVLPEAIPKKSPAINLSSPGSVAPLKATLPFRKCGKDGQELEFVIEDRNYRVRGLEKNLSYDILRINLRVFRGEKYHVDILDLYQARQRVAFIKATAQELGVHMSIIQHDLGRILLTLEELQERTITKALEVETPKVQMSERERAEAEAYLRAPNLLERIADDYEFCGLVGERTNTQVGHLGCISCNFEEPLGTIIQSLSAAGKTALMKALLKFQPPEKVVKYTALTGQSLFYMEEKSLKHKILAIIEEKGAEKATYAIKVLQSEGNLTIASTGKDPKSGRQITHDYHVDGPAHVMLATTAAELDEEFQNRGLVLTVNETRKQTKAIHDKQREDETLEGILHELEVAKKMKLHQNINRLLRPILVVNPYARYLTFMDNRLRARRDHPKYLTLIKAIAFLHQYQRPVHKKRVGDSVLEFIEVTLSDIETANRLCSEVMGISLDELSPQTRKLLSLIYEMVKQGCQEQRIEHKEYRFSQRQVREYSDWGHTQLKVHLARLVEMEYLLTHGGGRGQQYLYELVYKGEGEDGNRFLLGLLDIQELRNKLSNYHSHPDWSGQNGNRSGQNG
ncbi:MAG: toprim domain-containing protein, partial [Candidatus Tectomicrobia bacterium]|nr:toprim domain-containing protein [Candidatus Tectomicrobia bacterium]